MGSEQDLDKVFSAVNEISHEYPIHSPMLMQLLYRLEQDLKKAKSEQSEPTKTATLQVAHFRKLLSLVG